MKRKSLKDRIKPIVYPIIHFILRQRIKNKNFTIICDNCWSGKVYRELGLPYQTPFVGMFVFSPDYIKMLRNLKHYLSGNIPLKFVKDKLMKDFEELLYKSKVILSSKNYSNLPSLVHFKSAEKQGHVGIDLKTYHRYFNVVTWLNKGGEDLT